MYDTKEGYHVKAGPHEYPEQEKNFEDIMDCIHEQWTAERQEYLHIPMHNEKSCPFC